MICSTESDQESLTALWNKMLELVKSYEGAPKDDWSPEALAQLRQWREQARVHATQLHKALAEAELCMDSFLTDL